MRFQVEHEINIPFFLSLSFDSYNWDYDEEKIKTIAPGTQTNGANGPGNQVYTYAHDIMDGLAGFQIKLNQTLYVPLFLFMGTSLLRNYADESYLVEGKYTLPAIEVEKSDIFFGSGLFINTDIFKGSVYVGALKNNYYEYITANRPDEDNEFKFTIAFLPVLNTSNWDYVGKALNYIMGFIGVGDVVYNFEEKGDSKFDTFMGSLNLLLNFTFNKLYFNFITLDTNVYYKRNNYDTFAKTDTFGMELQGRFPRLPLAFRLNGGYKYFYITYPDFASAYHDTGFFDGSIYFILGRFGNLGLTCQFDSVTNTKLTFSYSNNFLTGMILNRPKSNITRNFDGHKVEGIDNGEEYPIRGFSIRYRHGGWRTK